MQANGMNRRGKSRVSCHTNVHVVFGTNKIRMVSSTDIGEGGIGLPHIGAPAKQPVKVSLSTEDQKYSLLLDGRVAWHKLSGTGIEFINPSAEQLASLRRILQQKS